MEQNVRTPTDVFKRHFDIPSLPSNVVSDFKYFDYDKRASAPESILLNSGSRGNLQGVSAVSTHWIGGMGKATALKRICRVGSVRSAL